MHGSISLHDWLTLHHAPKLGARRALKYLQHYGDIVTLRSTSAAELKANGMHQVTIQFLQQPCEPLIERDLAWGQQTDHHILIYTDAAYPPQLREISAAPVVLFATGVIDLLKLPQIAVVGSRRPTAAGLRHTHNFVGALVNYGLTITSGLALGIDTAAHRAALDYNAPTVAVIATGSDLVYPTQNKKLAERIAEDGVIVSEFSCGIRAKSQHFPQRNRLISGLSLGVLVVEAARRSGSLITASFACEQNREVLALPGSVSNPMVAGCHRLIQQGAKLVHTPEDIIAELAPMLDISATSQMDSATTVATPEADLNPHQQEVLIKMEYDSPTTADDLVTRCNLPISEILSTLSALELKGYISVQNSVYIRLL